MDNIIQQYIKTILTIVIDYSFITCKEHKIEMIKNIENVSTNLFLYNWCKDTNKILNGTRTDYDTEDVIQSNAVTYFKRKFRNK